MAFEFTSHMSSVSNQLWAVTSGVGAGLCFIVLLVIAAVAYHPRSRVHLDRVSFRIVVYALCANFFFGVASTVGGSLTGPGFLCGFSIFVLQLTLEFSSFLLFSIALNLQLVVAHGVNGQRMEKFYVIMSALMAIILTVPTYAAGQYGWDPLVQDCWYTNDNQKQRLIWQVMTQLAWTGLTAIGEIVCSVTVMIIMLQHTLRFRRIFVSTHSFSRTSLTAPQVVHAKNYRKIILRVALYPLASCFVNLLSIMCVIHATVADGVHNETDYNILLLSDFLYGGRAVVYALLAASDPALIRGVKTLFSQLVYGTSSQMTSSQKFNTNRAENRSTLPAPSNALVVHVELSTIHSPPLKSPADKDVNGSIEAIDKSSGNHFGNNDRSIGNVEMENDVSVIVASSDQRVPVPGLDLRSRREEMQRQEQDFFKRQI